MIGRVVGLLLTGLMASASTAQEVPPPPPAQPPAEQAPAPAEPIENAPAPAEDDPNPVPETEPAEAISSEIFGPRVPADLAFGAFQRGYFLTALEFALPRAEKGDVAAQTLIAEIYAKGLGVAQNDERAAGWYSTLR